MSRWFYVDLEASTYLIRDIPMDIYFVHDSHMCRSDKRKAQLVYASITLGGAASYAGSLNKNKQYMECPLCSGYRPPWLNRPVKR